MKKTECANRFVCLFFSVAIAVLCVFFAGMEAKDIMPGGRKSIKGEKRMVYKNITFRADPF